MKLIAACAIVAAVIGALSGTLTARWFSGAMPLEITRNPEIKALSGAERLAYLHGAVQRTAGAGPQALEGYTLVSHPSGNVGLAMGTIGNVELAGAGATTSARALQGGVVVSGPGRIEHATSLYLAQARRLSTYDGPTNVGRVDYISFDNGWSIRPDGDALLICDPEGRCRAL